MTAKKSFLEEVAAKDVTGSSTRCRVAIWLEDNPDVTNEDLKKARDRHSLKAIWAVMVERGYTSRSESVSNHLRGECKCLTSSIK